VSRLQTICVTGFGEAKGVINQDVLGCMTFSAASLLLSALLQH